MTTPAAGWYTDPAGTGGVRWWDGYRWTGNIHPPAGYPPTGYPPTGYPPAGYRPAGPDSTGDPTVADAGRQQTFKPGPGYGGTGSSASLLQRNRLSLIAVAVIAGYAVLAFVVHIVLFGLLPILFAVRAVRAREPLAVPAVVLSALVLVFALYQIGR